MNTDEHRLLLRAASVTFAYGARVAVRDVSISLSAGEMVGIIGPNGSGKSTLIRCLLGQHAASGSVEWEGNSIRDWRPRDLARRIAYLPQAPTSDDDQTVEEVLRTGRAPYWRAFGIESERDVRIIAETAMLLDLNDFLPRPMFELSGGQRQRVFLARCLVQEPAAMLLDEPNTFLDLKHQVELLRLLRKLTRERSIGVLMTSHDINLSAAFSDRLVLLKDGAVAAEGAPDDVMRPKVLEPVYGLPMRALSDETGRRIVVPFIQH